jgi:AcrR family transcriptional regulator
VLVDAARTVFERVGYADARLIDITTEAGMSAGSFYTYFTNKEEILAAVLEELQEEMVHPQVERVAGAETPVRIIEAATRAYLTSYQKNARLMRLLEEVADIDDNFRKLRARRNEAFARRNARSIRNLQIRGLADPELDPRLAAGALGLMVARVAYRTFVDGEPWEFEELVSTMTRLWANALQIAIDPPES